VDEYRKSAKRIETDQIRRADNTPSSLPPSTPPPQLLTFAATVAVGHGVSVLLAVAVIVGLGFGRMPRSPPSLPPSLPPSFLHLLLLPLLL